MREFILIAALVLVSATAQASTLARVRYSLHRHGIYW
jgi:hypothetical protein